MKVSKTAKVAVAAAADGNGYGRGECKEARPTTARTGADGVLGIVGSVRGS